MLELGFLVCDLLVDAFSGFSSLYILYLKAEMNIFPRKRCKLMFQSTVRCKKCPTVMWQEVKVSMGVMVNDGGNDI